MFIATQNFFFPRISVGIDVGKKLLDFCLVGLRKEEKITLGSGNYPNTQAGFEKIVSEIKKRLKTDDLTSIFFVIESTGVYHEEFRNYLYKLGYKVIQVLPNKSKAYAKSLNLKTKTDKVDAKMLAHYGIERIGERLWAPFDPCYLRLKRLTRLRESLIVTSSASKNRLHASKTQSDTDDFDLKILNDLIEHLKESIKEIDKELARLVVKSPKLKVLHDRLKTIPGYGSLTALVVIAETNGFENFTNRRQLVSYVGFDIIERTSGSSVRGRTRISKRGNSHIRRIFYTGAGHFKNADKAAQKLYARLSTEGDLKARVPIMRKMLVIGFALVKNKTDFDPAVRLIGKKLVNTETGEVINETKSQPVDAKPKAIQSSDPSIIEQEIFEALQASDDEMFELEYPEMPSDVTNSNEVKQPISFQNKVTENQQASNNEEKAEKTSGSNEAKRVNSIGSLTLQKSKTKSNSSSSTSNVEVETKTSKAKEDG
jgi:transposase